MFSDEGCAHQCPWNHVRVSNEREWNIAWDEAGFKAEINVEVFTPEEVRVKVLNNFVVVDSKPITDRRRDQQMIQHYYLPEHVDGKLLMCNLFPTGILSLYAPTKISTRLSNEIEGNLAQQMQNNSLY